MKTSAVDRRGFPGNLWQASETDLLNRLQSLTPIEDGSTMAAPAGRNPEPAAIRAVRPSPHWEVRMAGHALRLFCGRAGDSVEDEKLLGAGVGQCAEHIGLLGHFTIERVRSHNDRTRIRHPGR